MGASPHATDPPPKNLCRYHMALCLIILWAAWGYASISVVGGTNAGDLETKSPAWQGRETPDHSPHAGARHVDSPRETVSAPYVSGRNTKSRQRTPHRRGREAPLYRGGGASGEERARAKRAPAWEPVLPCLSWKACPGRQLSRISLGCAIKVCTIKMVEKQKHADIAFEPWPLPEIVRAETLSVRTL